jgi:hypothetical protein
MSKQGDLQQRLQEHLAEGDVAWEKKLKELRAKGLDKDELHLERLCFFADIYHEGYQMVREAYAEDEDYDEL